MNRKNLNWSNALPVSMALILLSGCGNGGGVFADPTPQPMPVANAASVITIDNAREAVNGRYTIVLEGGMAITDGNVSTASYYSEPMGSGDPIIVKVISPDESNSYDKIWNDYEAARLMRPSEEAQEGIGDDAYIAYPSIHVYSRGCEIIITAGSGSDDGQSELLKSLALTAVSNLSTIMPEVSDDV